jgi:conserved oligomeric Golgi complex subunit 6
VGLSANTRPRHRRWVQNECRGLGEADAPEVDPVLQRATAALRARPVLLRYCAEEVP